ncbi:hypothetical protein IWW48_002237 [Coemansia sp. RSA 1200]|nr:hypothetical protein IWW48_002237 [Coemansia sp. RSA 1200]
MSRPQPSQRQQAKETAAPGSSSSSSSAARSRQRTQPRDSSSGHTPEQQGSIESSENEDSLEGSPEEGFDDSNTGATGTKSRQRQRRDSSAASGEQDILDQQIKHGGGRKGGSTKHIPCKFYKHGNCTAGSNCFFSHDMNIHVEKPVCKYFVKGNCRYGSKCALVHIDQNDTSPLARPLKTGSNNNSSGNNNNGRNAQATRGGSGSNGNGGFPQKGSARNGPGASGFPKKEAAATANGGLGDSAGRPSGGRQSGFSGPENKMSLLPRNTAFNQGVAGNRTTSSASPQDDSTDSVGSNDNDVTDAFHPARVWTPGAIGSALREDRHKANQKSSTIARNRNLQSDSGVFEFGQASMYGLTDEDTDDIDSFLFGEQHGSNSDSPLRSNSDAVGSHGTNTKSQPIPNPGASGFSHPFRGGDGTHAHGGLSMQDSMRIDNLALSHGAAHQPFAGSPFLSSSIPLLDQFRDITRAVDTSPSAGGSPMAQSFARSPHGDVSSHLANRHAFTAVSGSTLMQDTPALEDIGSTLRMGYHGSLQQQQHLSPIHKPARNGIEGPRLGHLDMSPAMDPIGGARSVPRNVEIFGRSFRSSSLANDSEPLSPLVLLATGAEHNDNNGAYSKLHAEKQLGSSLAGANRQAVSGRFRSNSHILSPTLSGLSTITDGKAIGNNVDHRDAARSFQVSSQNSPFLSRDSQGGGYSLMDIHSLPFDSPFMADGNNTNKSPGMGSIWDNYGPYPSTDISLEREQRLAQGQQISYQQQRQNWTQSVNTQRQPASYQSPFASAIGSIQNEYTKSGMGSQLDGSRPGAIGQRLRAQNNTAMGMIPSGLSNSFTGGSQLSNLFGSGKLSLSTENSAQANNGRLGHGNAVGGSANGSSAASDSYDDMFELEQDAPPRGFATNGANNLVAPNPQFISMEGFAQRLSRLTASGHGDNSSADSVKTEGMKMAIPTASALSRPSV